MKKNLFLLGASVALTLLICEALIRIIGFERMTITPLTGFHEYDKELGWKLIPNYEGRFVHRDFDIEVKTNSDGFRDREYQREKTPDTVRIVSLGDSFTWGWGVENNEIYMEVAENILDGVEILNMGQNGYSTGQELLLLKRAVKAYSPDFVTLGFFINDLDENVAGRGKPLFDVVDGEIKITEPPESQTLELRVKSILVENSYLFVLINYGYERISRWLKQSPASNEHQALSSRYSIYMTEPNEEVEKEWNVFENITHEMIDEIDGNLIIIYIPNRSEVELDKNAASKNNGSEESYARNRISQFALENDIRFVDLTETFRDKYKLGEAIYFEHDGHMTRMGHQRAGEVLAEELRSILGRTDQ